MVEFILRSQAEPPSTPSLQVALIAAAAVALGALVGFASATFNTWLKGRQDLKAAENAPRVEVAKRRETMRVEKLEAAYAELGLWIEHIVEHAEDICEDEELNGLPKEGLDEYAVCRFLHKGILRLPDPAKRGQYMWGKRVEGLYNDFRSQVVTMATMVVVDGQRYPEPHGHERLEDLAEQLKYEMNRELFNPSKVEPS